MIKYIEVINHRNDSLRIDIYNPWETGFVIEEIKGLDPGKATINVSDVSAIDGGRYNSARYSKRTINIRLRFLLLDGITIEELRHKCYKYFTVKQPVTLIVRTDTRYVKAYGYVESLDSTIFSKTEGANIAIVCPDPFLYNADPDQVTEFNAVEPMFEFPFENDSLEEPVIEMGDITVHNYRTIYYDGDHESGYRFFIHSLGRVENVYVLNVDTGEIIGVDHEKLVKFTGSGLVKGDDIEICTERGNKYIHLIREGVTYNIINCLMANSKWLQLSAGNNIITFNASYGPENLQFRLSNKMLYEGI